MKSKTVTVVIVVAIVIGILAIIGITALVVYTANSSEPRVVDLNENSQAEEIQQKDSETENNDDSENENDDEDENQDQDENQNEDDNDENTENDETKSFNSKFEKFEGDRVSGKRVNELLDIIRNNNSENEEHQVKAMAKVQNWDKDNNKAVEDSMYDIDCEKDDETGYITTIEIEDAD